MFEFIESLQGFFVCVGDINSQVAHVRLDGLDYIVWYHCDGLLIDIKQIGSGAFIAIGQENVVYNIINSYLMEKFYVD